MTDTRVLLVSPVRQGPRVDGDHILTQLFLQRPPDGVVYEHYTDALAAGWLQRGSQAGAWLASLAMQQRPPAGVDYQWDDLPPLPFRLLGKLRPARPDEDVQWLKASEPCVDLIHSYMLPVRLEGALKRVPLVMGNASGNLDLLRNYYPLPERDVARLVARDRRLLRRLGIAHDSYHSDAARLITVPSRYAWRLHVEAGVPEAKLRLVRLGMVTPEWAPRQTDPATCRFTLVGQGFRRKGGQLLLDAFARLHARHPEARLTIVSHVPREELPEIPPGVELISSLPRAEVLGRIYPATDVYVLPTLAEGYGLSVVEAMAHGLPVIASQVGALSELVQDGVTGRLVPPGDVNALYEAMTTLMEDAALRQHMGAAGHAAFLAEHAVEVTNRALAAVYNEALQ